MTAQQATGSYGTSKNLAKPQDPTANFQQPPLVMLVLTSRNVCPLGAVYVCHACVLLPDLLLQASAC